jgi:hypothetical protein
MVYPEIYPAYREMLENELGMTSEPQDLVRLADFDSVRLERLAFRSNLYQRSRVKCRTYRAKRRNSAAEQATPLSIKLKFEAALLFGKLGGMLGWETPLGEEYFRGLADSDYVQDKCLSHLRKLRPSAVVSASSDGFSDTPWLIAAGLMGIPRAVWMRSWDNITTKCELVPDAELFLVWSEFMERELRLYFPGYNHRRILRIGTPQFDGHHDLSNIIPRKEFCQRMGLDPNRPIVLYCTGGTHICHNEHLVIKHVHEVVQGPEGRWQPTTFGAPPPLLLGHQHRFLRDDTCQCYVLAKARSGDEGIQPFHGRLGGRLPDHVVELLSSGRQRQYRLYRNSRQRRIRSPYCLYRL